MQLGVKILNLIQGGVSVVVVQRPTLNNLLVQGTSFNTLPNVPRAKFFTNFFDTQKQALEGGIGPGMDVIPFLSYAGSPGSTLSASWSGSIYFHEDKGTFLRFKVSPQKHKCVHLFLKKFSNYRTCRSKRPHIRNFKTTTQNVLKKFKLQDSNNVKFKKIYFLKRLKI